MSSKLESDVCCRLQVAPSGESYEGKGRPGRKQWQTTPGIWRDSLHVTCGLTACTPGSAAGPTLGNEYGKTLPLPYLCPWLGPALWFYGRRHICTYAGGVGVTLQGVTRVTSHPPHWRRSPFHVIIMRVT